MESGNGSIGTEMSQRKPLSLNGYTFRLPEKAKVDSGNLNYLEKSTAIMEFLETEP